MSGAIRLPGRAVAARLVAGNIAFVLAVTAVGAAAIWPIYRDSWFWLVAAVAASVSLTLGGLAAVRGGSWARIGVMLAIAYVVLGVALAHPSVWADAAQLPDAIIGVITAPVTGPRNLLTLPLPLGTYQSTLAPALLVLLAAPGPAVVEASRDRRSWPWASAIAITPVLFGIGFGAATTSSPVHWGPVSLPAPRELVVGLAAALLCVLWLLWRSAARRRIALADTGGASVTTRGGRRRGARAQVVRGALGVGMLSLAVIIAGIVAPWALADQPREVPRTQTEPMQVVREALSPLAEYRAAFAGDAYDGILFTVSSPDADRVRVATLSFYDGTLARVSGPDAAPAFQRVPAAFSATASGSRRVEVELGAWSTIWVPTVGEVTGMSFSGDARRELTDGFYYNRETSSGIEVSPAFGPGTRYTMRSDPEPTLALSDAIAPRTGTRLDPDTVPESVATWVGMQQVGSDGAGLQRLVDALRQRGYLSHSLADDAAAQPWIAGLGEYTFAASRAGHSTERIDALFRALIDRQLEAATTPGVSLVAAPGDDEQFAVAVAMIADQLGFPARIVVGARLEGDASLGIPPCTDGVCRGRNLAAWVEVQDVSGRWIPVDVTPQHTQPLDAAPVPQRDPENPTRVDDERADTVLPPAAEPADADPRDTDESESASTWAALWRVAALAGGSLLMLAIVVGPFLAIVIAKAWRRRRRRRAADARERVAGGWWEWVDTAADHGARPEPGMTRSEFARTARVSAGDAAAPALLAEWADAADFSPDEVSQTQADRFWHLVDSERDRFEHDGSWWQRVRAALSLRSLRRRR